MPLGQICETWRKDTMKATGISLTSISGMIRSAVKTYPSLTKAPFQKQCFHMGVSQTPHPRCPEKEDFQPNTMKAERVHFKAANMDPVRDHFRNTISINNMTYFILQAAAGTISKLRLTFCSSTSQPEARQQGQTTSNSFRLFSFSSMPSLTYV